MNKPLISIIVPIYNVKEEFLKKSIESIINQTLKEIEIILVNDESTEENLKICKDFQKHDNRIIIISIKKQGVSKARNEGIKQAKSDWITFVDADDWIEKESLEKMYEATQREKNIDLIISSCYVEEKDKRKKNMIYYKEGILNHEDKTEIELEIIAKGICNFFPIEGCVGVPWAKLYNKNFLINNKIEFNVKLRRMQDTLFSLYTMEYAKKIVYIDEYLYHYRKSRNLYKLNPNILENYETLFKEIDYWIKKFKKGNEFVESKKILINYSVEKIMNSYFINLENKKNKRDIKNQIIKLLYSERYIDAIKTVNTKYLSIYQRILNLCWKKKYIECAKKIIKYKEKIKSEPIVYSKENLEVLISEMNILKTHDIVTKMNIKCNSLIINQVNDNKVKIQDINEGKNRILNYNEKGASRSRNRAIENMKGDICILADDDVIYEDNYIDTITNAYNNNPKADIIVFYIENNNNERAKIKKIKKGKISFANVMKVRTPEITFKKEAILKNQIQFNKLFGPGTKFKKGEETIFIWNCIKNKMKVISVAEKIGIVENKKSTWFKGHNLKFFYDQGAIFYQLSNSYYKILILQYVLRKKRLYKNKYHFNKIYKIMNMGAIECKKTQNI